MALASDAAMVLFYDVTGDGADHDDWHSHEHFHERLSIPGFLRATRWGGATGRLVLYEVSGLEVATSAAYLERLNAPTEWTRAMMPRFRGMVRGFATVLASAGFGLGQAARALRFTPQAGAEAALVETMEKTVLPAMAQRRGMAGCCLMRPAPAPPMTEEQALRGTDTPLPWVILATGWDGAALDAAFAAHLRPSALVALGAAPGVEDDAYRLSLTATAAEAARTPKPVERPQGA